MSKTTPPPQDEAASGTSESAITIKKYANRRLYNTASSSYVTLDHLAEMVKDGKDFIVTDARTGEDITRQVLTQIIVEQEAKGVNLLPVSFLRQLISMYGNGMQWMVPSYLDYAMQAFVANQDRMQDNLTKAFSGIFPMEEMQKMNKQNLAMMEQAMRMFTGGALAGMGTGTTTGSKAASGDPDEDAETIEALRREIDELHASLSEKVRQNRAKTGKS